MLPWAGLSTRYLYLEMVRRRVSAAGGTVPIERADRVFIPKDDVPPPSPAGPGWHIGYGLMGGGYGVEGRGVRGIICLVR